MENEMQFYSFYKELMGIKNNMNPDVVDYLEVSLHVDDDTLFTEGKVLGDTDGTIDVSGIKEEPDTEKDEIFIDFSKINHSHQNNFQDNVSQSSSYASDSFLPYSSSCSPDQTDTIEGTATQDETDSEDSALYEGTYKCEVVNLDFQGTISQIKKEEESDYVPSSESDDSEEEDNEDVKNVNIKRQKGVRNEHRWKRNVRQHNRLLGKEYLSTNNVVVKGKSILPPCYEKCRLKCNKRFTEEQRLKICSKYWKIKSWEEKRKFVRSCIKTLPVARPRKRDSSGISKTKTHKYTFTINNKREVVCKTFFKNTLSISTRFMQNAVDTSSRTAPPRKRIKKELLDS